MNKIIRALGAGISDRLFMFQVRTGLILMASDQSSREATRTTSSTYGYKMHPASAGPLRVSNISGPATITWAQGDTMGNRDKIPAGSRILGAIVSCADMGTSITLDVGLRAWKSDGTGAAISAAGIVSALDVATAAISGGFYSTGSLITAGAEYVTTADAEPYFTLNGGTPTANALIRVQVLWVGP